MSPETVGADADIRLLTAVYQAIVDAVQKAIDVYSRSLNTQQAETAALEVLAQHGGQWPSDTLKKIFANRKLINFSIQSSDNHNRPVTMKNGEYCGHVKTASMMIYDVPSLEYKGKTLGSVIFGESFLDSAFTVTYPDGSSQLASDRLVLTSHVPRFITWPISKADQVVSKQVREATKLDELSGFGRLLLKGEEVYLPSATSKEVIRHGEVFIYEEGLVYRHKHVGSIVLPKNKMTSVHFYDGDSPSVVAFLMMTLTPDLMPFLPPGLHHESGHVTLAFMPKTSAYKSFYSEVLSVWRGDDQKPMLEMTEDLPDEWASAHLVIQKEFVAHTTKTTSAMKTASANLPQLDCFMTHFEATSCLNKHAVPSNDVAALINEPFDAGAFDDQDELILTIISGVPGSHKENLCNTVTKTSKDDSRWAVFRYPLENVEGFSVKNLQSNLTSALAAYRKRKPGTSKKKMRAVILTPGFADIVEVVQAIYTHPDKDVASRIKIGAVTVCVDPLNFYISDRYCLPGLLDQCAQGWVNNIIFTSNQAAQDATLIGVQELIRAVNSDVALLLAERGEVIRTPDMDLILSDSAFSSGPLVRARHLSCPGWSLGHYHCDILSPEISDVRIHFSQPLDKQRLFNKLKGLKSSHRKHPFHGNVYGLRGKFRFTASETPYEVHFVTLSNYVSSTPTELQPAPPARSNGPNQPSAQPYSIVFTGVNLQVEMLKTWLRECAPQKPERKVLRTKKSLTQTEIKKVHAEHHLEPLPEGWYYNGSQYVCLDGEKSKTHPRTAHTEDISHGSGTVYYYLDQFLDRYLEMLNKEVEEHNSRVDALNYKDIFA